MSENTLAFDWRSIAGRVNLTDFCQILMTDQVALMELQLIAL